MTVESGAATTAALSQPPASQPPASQTQTSQTQTSQTQPSQTQTSQAPDPDQPGGLVQLLTPEGERIDHPDYPLDLSATEIYTYADTLLPYPTHYRSHRPRTRAPHRAAAYATAPRYMRPGT